MTSEKYGWKFKCDYEDCDASIALTLTKLEAIDALRDTGWSVVGGEDRHRCPKHAYAKK